MSRFTSPESVRQATDEELRSLRDKPEIVPVGHVYQIDTVKEDISELVSNAYPNLDHDIPPIDIVTPPRGIDADLAVPAFPLAKPLRRSPAVIAAEVEAAFNTDAQKSLASVKATGPYVNVGLDRGQVLTGVIADAMTLGRDYGRSDQMAGQTRVIDYSSPNASKLMGMQHTRTTFVGESNARIQEANGANVVRTNYVGDFGKPTGKILLAIEKYGLNLQGIDPVREMNELYVQIGKDISAHPELNAAADRYAAMLEDGDPAVVKLWERIRELGIDENKKLYDELGIRFDTTIGESSFIARAHAITDELLRLGIALEDDGAVIVPAGVIKAASGSKTAQTLMLRNSRKKTTYGSRDLAALGYRMEEYAATSVEYVVGAEQSGYLESVFAVAGLAGIIKNRDTVHHTELGLLLNASGKKMSSRDGSASPLVDEMAKKYQTALSMIKERGVITDSSEQHELARMLGYGELIYSIVSKDPLTNIPLGQDGTDLGREGTPAHVQYSHARATSVVTNNPDYAGLLNPIRLDSAPTETEWNLTKAIMDYPEAVRLAGGNYSPAHIATSTEGVANAFNAFYQRDSVRNAPTPERRLARIALARAAKITLKNGLSLLNVGAPDKM